MNDLKTSFLNIKENELDNIIVSLVKLGFKETEIEHKLKEKLNKDVNKSEIRRIVRNYNMKNSGNKIKMNTFMEYEKSEKKGEKQIMSRMFINREEIDKLLNEGYTIAGICKYYQEKGIDVKYDRLYHLVNQYRQQDGKKIAPKASTKEMIELREKGYTYSEIAKILTEDGKKITSQGVYLRLERFYNLRGENAKEGEKSGIEKMKILRNEDKVELDNILQKEIIFKGTTVDNWCRNTGSEYLKDCLTERLNKLIIIATNAKKENGQLVPDKDFVEILKCVGDNKPTEPYKKYNLYLREYINKYGVLKYGAVDTLREKVFKNNSDLMVYILEGYQPKFAKEEYTNNEQYDEKIYNQKKKAFKGKVSTYVKRLELIEARAELQKTVEETTRTIEGNEDPVR